MTDNGALWGQSSAPYYPSPWGEGSGDWAAAYAKARTFVSGLTLTEKVNLTTGVGYVVFPASYRSWLTMDADGRARSVSETTALFQDSTSSLSVLRTLHWESETVSSPCLEARFLC